ncbi:MAG: glycosyltransferase family 2 protein [Deltaproteobacteria bacterium]|nr:glycosyltransferase family 2 protein [Deltaproteobacteria bacterium]MBW2567114.1 glycosyltransferase family 2 protein [Deltaproteobacteria bacterium]
MHDISLSVFFPCYNEELNIEGLILEAIRVLDRSVQEYEILVINDGSTDKTGLIADRLSEKHEHVRVIHHSRNRGYGAALISGFGNSINEWVFFTDGDRQFLISEIELLLNHIDYHDLIIGFRKARRDPWHRILYGHTWTRVVQLLFGLKVRDINCAFKLVKRTIMDGITLHSSGAVINAELMIRAKLSGAYIKQVGVSHRPRMFGKQTGGNPKVILKALRELMELRKEL